MSRYYYEAVLSIDPKKKDVQNKTGTKLLERALHWSNNLKNINEVLYRGPFLDKGENGNIHINFTLFSDTISNRDIIRNKYFKSWMSRKGYVHVDYVRNLVKWNEYAERNHYELLKDIIIGDEN